MPKSGEVAPVPSRFPLDGIRGEHFRCKLGGPPGDFVEMAVLGVESLAPVAVFPLALIQPFTKWREERFPF